MPSDDGQILRNLQSHRMTVADFRRICTEPVLPHRIAAERSGVTDKKRGKRQL